MSLCSSYSGVQGGHERIVSTSASGHLKGTPVSATDRVDLSEPASPSHRAGPTKFPSSDSDRRSDDKRRARPTMPATTRANPPQHPIHQNRAPQLALVDSSAGPLPTRHDHPDTHHQAGPTERPSDPAAPEQAPVLYTPTQAAQLLQVRESWLRRRAAQRRVPCTFLGKHLRFSAANLDQIIADAARPNRGATPTPETRSEGSRRAVRRAPTPVRISSHRPARPSRRS